EGFVVGSFSQVTSDFGEVIRRLNERFETGFGVFDHTPENVSAVFAQIDKDYRRRLPQGEKLEREGARPSKGRAEMKAKSRAEWDSPKLAVVRGQAEGVYRSLSDDGS